MKFIYIVINKLNKLGLLQDSCILATCWRQGVYVVCFAINGVSLESLSDDGCFLLALLIAAHVQWTICTALPFCSLFFFFFWKAISCSGKQYSLSRIIFKRFKAIHKYWCSASLDGTNGRRGRWVKVVCENAFFFLIDLLYGLINSFGLQASTYKLRT